MPSRTAFNSCLFFGHAKYLELAHSGHFLQLRKGLFEPFSVAWQCGQDL
jgi:hypothetical protein